MKVFLDCVPCNLRQVLEAARLATNDESIHSKILQDSLSVLKDFADYGTSPELCRDIHLLVTKYTGVNEPYGQLKAESIEVAHKLYPTLEEHVKQSTDKLGTALEVSAIGNLIDAAVYGVMDTEKLGKQLKQELNRGFAINNSYEFRKELTTAKTILFIGDNAGETVFDKLLILEAGELAQVKPQTYFAVRSAPIINDATKEDAIASGLDQVATIIDSGSKAPGMVLSDASPEFRRIFERADVIIAKGQGNYETLSDTKEKPIYYLLKAKCSILADHIGVKTGDYVFVKI